MKKLLIITLTLFFSFSLMGMRRDRNNAQDSVKKSRIEFDDLYYLPSKDGNITQKNQKNVDTLLKEKTNITINYYNRDPFFYSNRIGRFYHGGFNYWAYSDPFFYMNYDWRWDYRYTRTIYWGNPWLYRPYYSINNFYSVNQQPINNIQNIRRDRVSTLTSNKIVQIPETPKVAPQNKPINQENRTPSYSQPRFSVVPPYNNSKVSNAQSSDRRSAPSVQPQTPAYSSPTSRQVLPSSSRSINAGSLNGTNSDISIRSSNGSTSSRMPNNTGSNITRRR
jgi:hypothetical protein